MTKSERMARNDAARKRRRTVKDIVFERTMHFYDKMRKLRKKHNSHKKWLRLKITNLVTTNTR